MKLKDKRIVLGVSGGIACYKSPEIVRGIREAGGEVSVIMTRAAMEFIKPLVFQTLSENAVATSLFSLAEENQIGHIKVVEDADAMIIAPATANMIGKIAHGIADDYLSTSFLACTAPVLVAPAMNHHMWDHPAVQENIAVLRRRGIQIIEPGSGYLACGSFGVGRMAEPERIVETVQQRFENGAATLDLPLKQVRVLITAGPTRERIDPVRYLSNDSSGKMGYALAAHCRDLGAAVVLVSGPTALTPPPGIDTIQVVSAREMMDAVLERASQSQIIIKAAAVSDFTVEVPNPHKTKKSDSLTLHLKKSPDILKTLGDRKGSHQFLVGFAAESQDVHRYAEQKLKAKHLDLIVANNILQENAGFNADTNQVLLIGEEGATELPLMPKEEVARRIMAHIMATDKWQSIRDGRS